MNQNNLEKRLKMVNKPRHKEPTNFEHCCNCCGAQEKEIKHLKYTIKQLKERLKDEHELFVMFDEAVNARGGIM